MDNAGLDISNMQEKMPPNETIPEVHNKNLQQIPPRGCMHACRMKINSTKSSERKKAGKSPLHLQKLKALGPWSDKEDLAYESQRVAQEPKN